VERWYPEGVKFCGRPGKYGSPFLIVRASSRRGGPLDMWAVQYEGKNLVRFDERRDAAEDSVDRYQRYLDETVGEFGYSLAVEAKTDLAGLDLSCWCKLSMPCHVDVLLRVANPDFDWPPLNLGVSR
jgi:hypothetical protein